MHEMALCESMVELVEDEARRQGFSAVRSIVLEVGALGHVEPEAIRFCFEAASRGTLAEGARLVVERVAGTGKCPDCGTTVPIPERFAPCPVCGGTDVAMIAGDELRVRELEVV